MLMEVYYEHYLECCLGKCEDKGPKVLPYMVSERDAGKRRQLKELLEARGYRCVEWNDDYPGVLVNVKLRRFGEIRRACKHSCIEDRNFTLEEFMRELEMGAQQQ